jgi:hypothetical protein
MVNVKGPASEGVPLKLPAVERLRLVGRVPMLTAKL